MPARIPLSKIVTPTAREIPTGNEFVVILYDKDGRNSPRLITRDTPNEALEEYIECDFESHYPWYDFRVLHYPENIEAETSYFVFKIKFETNEVVIITTIIAKDLKQLEEKFVLRFNEPQSVVSYINLLTNDRGQIFSRLTNVSGLRQYTQATYRLSEPEPDPEDFRLAKNRIIESRPQRVNRIEPVVRPIQKLNESAMSNYGISNNILFSIIITVMVALAVIYLIIRIRGG